MWDEKKTARIAGIFYLLVGIFGGFAEGFVGPRMYAAGDAATTAQNPVRLKKSAELQEAELANVAVTDTVSDSDD